MLNISRRTTRSNSPNGLSLLKLPQ